MTETTTHGTMTSASDSAAQVQEYVSAVRAALSDLSLEEVEDLTAGMDADLGELLAERGGTLEVALGSPQAYAAELRTAAGLPAAAGPGRRTISLGDWSRAWSERVSVQMQRRPWLAGLLRGRLPSAQRGGCCVASSPPGLWQGFSASRRRPWYLATRGCSCCRYWA